MPSSRGRVLRKLLLGSGWGILALVVIVYGGYALAMGLDELKFLLGLGPETKHRAAPAVFVLHALAGALALFIGPLQSIKWIRRRAGLRRALGRTYVLSVWAAAVAALLDLRVFGASLVANTIFVAILLAWIFTTTMGMLRARARLFTRQHEWMVRSYAITLFFVTFTLWVPLLGQTPLPASVSYPLALFLSAALNLAVAELWIRRTRRPGPVIVEGVLVPGS